MLLSDHTIPEWCGSGVAVIEGHGRFMRAGPPERLVTRMQHPHRWRAYSSPVLGAHTQTGRPGRRMNSVHRHGARL
jgi:hypothetical protein